MPHVSNQGTRWCFTLNNYSAEELTNLQQLFRDTTKVKYGCYGLETAPGTGTPHVQGYVVCCTNKRLRGIKRLLGARVHCELARGSHAQNREYCSKEGGTFFESGSYGQQGRRTDLEALIRWSEEFEHLEGRPAQSPDIAKAQPAAYLKYPRFARLCERRAKPRQLQFGAPKEWQRELEADLNAEPDDRTIRFVVDTEGGKGKTWFIRYFLTKYPDKTQVLSIGKIADVAYAVDATKSVFLFNVPRNGMEHLQYRVLENIKDKMVFSPKYQSGMKFLNHNSHVYVFCNEHPDEEALSADRVDIVTV